VPTQSLLQKGPNVLTADRYRDKAPNSGYLSFVVK
jgi:hypothetical protein